MPKSRHSRKGKVRRRHEVYIVAAKRNGRLREAALRERRPDIEVARELLEGRPKVGR